jgi:hypothetical protein
MVERRLESPPPSTVYALASAQARATPRVPAAKGSISKTPIGPFHRTVFAPAITSPNRATESGPMSRPMRSAGISSAGTIRVAASGSIAAAATTSTGRWIVTPRRRACSTAARTLSIRSSSTSDRPTDPAAAATNVKAIAPPITSSSTRSTKASTTPSLSLTLAPPRIAT